VPADGLAAAGVALPAAGAVPPPSPVTATITVGTKPEAMVVIPDGSQVYVADFLQDGVSVIDTATDTVVAQISLGSQPSLLAISAGAGLSFAYTFAGLAQAANWTVRVTARTRYGRSPAASCQLLVA
jgi:YVTN family beta-propeller protein